MKRLPILIAFACAEAVASDPIRTAWILAAPPAPVVSVSVGEQFVTVRSAGVSLKYLGPLQSPPDPNARTREFTFAIPLHPEPEVRTGSRIPVDAAGVFLNGVPIYNHSEAASYEGADLWHYDLLVASDSGHPNVPGMLEELAADGTRHSPLIGFALDGYPVYGPWANTAGGLRAMRSSYRLRAIIRRETWPDGTVLTPAQYGPPVTAEAPLGTFAEDYEYVAGAGDLDESNGRSVVTPEYPEGTYAYFLSMGRDGSLAFPYVVGPRFHGKFRRVAAESFMAIATAGNVAFAASTKHFRAGEPVRFRVRAFDGGGAPVRHFEYVHERPIHLLIASADLQDFDHIHPELMVDDSFEVTHTFEHGGSYRLWADFSLPGEAPRVEHFDLDVAGAPPPAAPAVLPPATELRHARALVAGVDIAFTLDLPKTALQPYLGAWAHLILVSRDRETFAHIHPADALDQTKPNHTHIFAGPAPPSVAFTASFPHPGRYKLWAQYQQSGKVITVSYLLEAAAAPVGVQSSEVEIPANAIRVHVSARGFEPAVVTIPAKRVAVLAFTRDAAPNCGSEVVFPALRIRRALPLGETVLVQLPAQTGGDIRFSCGMKMYRGMVVAR